MHRRFVFVVVASLFTAVASAQNGPWTQLCDLNVNGNQALSGPFGEGYDMSDNGRFVVFSNFDPLDPRDLNGYAAGSYDVYVRDLELQQTLLISLDSTNTQAAGGCAGTDSGGAAISGNGRYVAFPSYSTSLVAGDTGLDWDVFVRDTQTNTTVRCSVTSTGGEPNNNCTDVAISADGRYVAFKSNANNIVPAAPSAFSSIYRFDRVTGQIALVSSNAVGAQPAQYSQSPSLSADGRFIAFASDSGGFGPSDANGALDVYRKDMLTGQVALVSMDLTTGAAPALGAFSISDTPSISADGRYLAFSSIVPFAPNDVTSGDVYLRDMVGNTHTLISVGLSGQSVTGSAGDISADGKHVVFTSASGNLVLNDTNGFADVFVRDIVSAQTTRESVSYAGGDANGHVSALAMSGNGRRVAMLSQCTNLVNPDNNGIWPDVFARDRGPSPIPQVYCIAKDNSLGCTPAIGFAGVPSATNANTFSITASNLLNNKTGTLFFGLSGPNNLPFQGGYLCVAAPTIRTGLVNSGGTPFGNDCTGTFQFDFNAYIAGGATPALQVAGQEFWAQFWSRDPADPFTTNVTDALDAVVGP